MLPLLTWLRQCLSGFSSIKLGASLPSGSDGKEFVSHAGDLGSVPGLGRSPGEGNGYHSNPPISSSLKWGLVLASAAHILKLEQYRED